VAAHPKTGPRQGNRVVARRVSKILGKKSQTSDGINGRRSRVQSRQRSSLLQGKLMMIRALRNRFSGCLAVRIDKMFEEQELMHDQFNRPFAEKL
jgi:hypothetical protein